MIRAFFGIAFLLACCSAASANGIRTAKKSDEALRAFAGAQNFVETVIGETRQLYKEEDEVPDIVAMDTGNLFTKAEIADWNYMKAAFRRAQSHVITAIEIADSLQDQLAITVAASDPIIPGKDMSTLMRAMQPALTSEASAIAAADFLLSERVHDASVCKTGDISFRAGKCSALISTAMEWHFDFLRDVEFLRSRATYYGVYEQKLAEK